MALLSCHISGSRNGLRQLTVGPELLAQAVAIACTFPNGTPSSLANVVRMPERQTHTRTV